MPEKRRLVCSECKEELVEARVVFSYLGHTFHSDLPKCPKCGQVYIDEELAKGRIAEVEMLLEDK